ncbi:MAG: hypothetical protein HND57_13390 [Planctomycetes bacterium]|nr:hypothetical protein [Planctomycetota bacterium]
MMNRAECIKQCRIAVLGFAVLLPSIICHAGTLVVPDAYPTIQDAINAAVDGDEILVREGLYYENLDLLGKRLVVRSEKGLDATVIDGQLEGAVITCTGGEPAGTLITGFTIQGGAGHDGGGVYCNFQSSLALEDCSLRDNWTFSYSGGGGVYVGSDCTISIVRCVFSGNLSDGGGGGITCSRATVEIVDTLFDENACASRGGAIYASGATMTLERVVCVGNRAQDGGGVYCAGGSNTLSQCEFVGNVAFYGAGMYLRSGEAEVTDSLFAENTAWYRGGGIMSSTGSLKVTSCELTGNRGDGGGIYAEYGDTEVVNCDFDENMADSRGAGIYARSVPSLFVSQSRFTKNEGRSGTCLDVTYCDELTVEQCHFEDNYASLDGAALKIAVSVGSITASDFVRNQCGDDGGAIAVSSMSTVALSNSTLSDNRADGSGGSIHIEMQGGAVNAADCMFTNNTAGGDGGAIYSDYAEQASYDSCTFAHNVSTTGMGGAIYTDYGTGSWITNCMFEKNRSAGEGGGLGTGFNAIVHLQDSLFCENSDYQVFGGWEDEGGLVITDDCLYLSVDPQPLIAGEVAVFSLASGVPGEQAYLAYSLVGYGDRYINHLDVTLDLAQVKQAGAPIVLDANGDGQWLLGVPQNAAGRDVWFQAAQYQNKSNVVSTTVE